MRMLLCAYAADRMAITIPPTLLECLRPRPLTSPAPSSADSIFAVLGREAKLARALD